MVGAAIAPRRTGLQEELPEEPLILLQTGLEQRLFSHAKIEEEETCP